MAKKTKKAAAPSAPKVKKAAAMLKAGADGELVPVVDEKPELLSPGPDGELPKN